MPIFRHLSEFVLLEESEQDPTSSRVQLSIQAEWFDIKNLGVWQSEQYVEFTQATQNRIVSWHILQVLFVAMLALG